MGLHTHNADAATIAWYGNYFGQLVGATITGFTLVKDDDMGDFWPTFKVKLAGGEEIEVEVSQDEEGNGPGWLFGLPQIPPVGR